MQSANADSPILVTLSGIVILVKLLHPLNANFSILVTLLGIITLFKLTQFLNVFLYALLFIPVHLIQALMLIWDGGLKEFTIAKRFLGYDILSRGSEAFSRAEQIWESK